MTAAEITGFVLTLLLMLVGLVGAVLPGLPGPPLVFVAALLHRLYFGDRSVAVWVVVVLGLLAVVSFAFDFAATTLGARKLGATWRGMVGAGVGAVVGLFVLPPLGLILCPLLGATLGELLGGRQWREAGKAGLGAALGLIAGTVGKIASCLTMIALFSLNLLLRHQISGN